MVFIAFIFLVIILFQISAPMNFPRGKIFLINKNSTVGETAQNLASANMIRSPFLYKLFVVLLHDGKGIQAGKYLFDSPQTALTVAYRTAFGKEGLEKISITIPEGSNSIEIAEILAKKIKDFDKETFVSLAKNSEGYLFPETYFFDQSTTPDEVVEAMTKIFDEKISAIQEKIHRSGKNLKDIIIMASILEEEENNSEDRSIISGILWKRIKAGMPLQVDAPFYYLYGKGSSQISKEDLASSSPYNTYKNKGLPIAPISNPSLDSILAAIEPKESIYWFYLSDKEGQTHYAIDHDDHVANKDKYLR